MPRQSYGIDFYGVPKGEILVIVDLCTRETTLAYMANRNQDKVTKALLSQIIFARGVPTSLRSQSAPELVAGWVADIDINAYLGIDQVRTGGYNPRGNAVCERANQTIGAMLRKCSDAQYNNIKDYLPAMAFAMLYLLLRPQLYSLRSRPRTTSANNRASPLRLFTNTVQRGGQ
jgi:transposase InsO family protein